VGEEIKATAKGLELQGVTEMWESPFSFEHDVCATDTTGASHSNLTLRSGCEDKGMELEKSCRCDDRSLLRFWGVIRG